MQIVVEKSFCNIFFLGEKPHPCEVCGKPFRVRSDMKRHLNTHSRRRPGRPTPVLESSAIEPQEQVESTETQPESNEPQPETETEEQPSSEVQYTQDPLEAVRERANTLYVMPILIS